MSYFIQHIAAVIHADAHICKDASIEYLLTDTRRIVFPASSLFFALPGPRKDGHEYINEAYERGTRNFVVRKGFDISPFKDANFLQVDDVLQALQDLAANHRKSFNIPVIGITGSNGKTIVKEWLNKLLQPDYNIVRSPRSYNSQVGVPLSVWQMNAEHTLGIFEAGISTLNEMEKLEQVIQPNIGVLTNIGEAHSEGFSSEEEKINEKLKLFTHCIKIIYCKDSLPASVKLPVKDTGLFSWSRNEGAKFFIKEETRYTTHTSIIITHEDGICPVTIPFADAASIDNAITCCCVMLSLQYPPATINERIGQLQPVEMRLQSKKAINNCYLLNDSYSNDLSSLSIALDHLKQQSGEHPTTVILSDIYQSGLNDAELYLRVASELKARNIHRLLGIGENIHKHHNEFLHAVQQTAFYSSTENFLHQITEQQFRDEFILLKGARVFAFEKISKWLEQKVHQTVLEINLSAIAHNLKVYQNQLLPSTKIMAMVKAFSYGSGSAEVARVLQFHKVDYLAVAYADEGVDLRKAGVSLPIMVMNTDEAGFDVLIENNLEPEIYSFPIYTAFHQYLQQEGITKFPVHIKLNTGMNRLGFDPSDIDQLSVLLKQDNTMAVKSVFSHLVASESATHDGFTKQQAATFDTACSILQKILGYSFIKHIANSAGIFRHPNLQYDMVRPGIGLYGVNSGGDATAILENVATLKSTIAQIREVKAGETIGYGRQGKLTRDSRIAIVRIGYADGFSRKMSNGHGSMYINGKLAPVTGNVCMDMTMIDITDIPGIKEGDEVEIFGKHLPVQRLAEWCGTIPYEIMAGVSQRVKRVYNEE